MNKNIQENLVQLLDAYLDDLKTEADTVTHIVNYINDSTAARAALAEQLESFFWARENGTSSPGIRASDTPRNSSQIHGKAEALLKGLAEFNLNQNDSSAGKGMS